MMCSTYHCHALVDAPSPPKGPLACKDMLGETCVLSWNAPDDDGGAEVANYLVEKKAVGAAK